MVLNSQNEKFAGFRLLAQIEARIDAVDRLKNKIDDLRTEVRGDFNIHGTKYF